MATPKKPTPEVFQRKSPLRHHQHGHAEKTDCQTEHGARPQLLAGRTERAEAGQPQRHSGDDQRRLVGRHPLFAPHHESIRPDQHEQRRDRDRAPFTKVRGKFLPAQACVKREQDTGHDEPRPGKQRRRQLLHADADREIGRAPDDIHRGEGDDDFSSPRGIVFHFIILLFLNRSS